MIALWHSLCNRLGVDPRATLALTRVLLLMDLRQQHYAAATASKPHYLISPLFWVVGQCLTLSAGTALFLFARVDVFFFALANLSLSLLVLAATVFVEFHEVVLNPRDLDVIGHRPVAPATYTAARLLNLSFYVVLMYLALNLLPLLIGAGLRDAGWWYLPAYLIASLAGSVTVVAGMILLLSLAGPAWTFDALKNLLAWVQIVLILVVGYGGQFMLRDTTYSVQMWGAFPPAWSAWLPSTWLARFVERAAVAPDWECLGQSAILVGVAVTAVAVAAIRLSRLYEDMQGAPRRSVVHRPLEAPGSLRQRWADWMLVSPLERVGFWLCRVQLRRDPSLLMRCLLPFQFPLAVTAVGFLLGQFANPLRETDASRVTLAILSVYLFAVAVPLAVHQLAYCGDWTGSWLWWSAPLARPEELVRGTCKAVMTLMVTPLVLLLAVVMWVAWADPVAAVSHALLAWLLCWPAAWAGVWLLLEAPPFSLSPVRGGTLGVPPLPLAALTMVAGTLTGLHYLFAGHWLFWMLMVPATCALSWWLRRRATLRLEQLWRPA
jgi:hypothetical protein